MLWMYIFGAIVSAMLVALVPWLLVIGIPLAAYAALVSWLDNRRANVNAPKSA
ncbi:hypothetical protein UFOVP1299_71 [uncultured Caudovirales phage]|uniref:Uncharacterized protein n=1 Tax=uncultured Caudovirales phage TaxID=2100421 RepID=A0A6J5RH98_9CAUD|nr:hypothetical protein UFOVP1299_71 [uncultured Caudovirales phage]